MTDKRMRSLCRWAGVIADEYGLKGWDLRLHVADAGVAEDSGDAIASVVCIWGRKIAHITISEDFFTCSPEEQRHVILHEFTHIHLWAAGDLVKVTICGMIGSLAWDAFRPGWVHAEEHAVDAIASAIERFYPLWEG